MVVFTGVSGSGKSSLALTPFSRRDRGGTSSVSPATLGSSSISSKRPEVDLIEGLPPTVAIDQRPGQASPRSTVGTITEIYDYLRLLFAQLGTPHCPSCGLLIHRQTPEQMAAHVMAFPRAESLLLAPWCAVGRDSTLTSSRRSAAQV